MNDFYVYAWRRPDADAIFYIGKGRGKRAKTPKKHNPIFLRIVEKLKRNGLSPSVEYLHSDIAEAMAIELERAEIAKHGRRDNGTGTLVNLTDGGDGLSGAVFSEDHKRKIGESKIGKPRSDELRAALSLAMRGRKLSDEHRAKIVVGLTGRTPSEETRLKLRAARGRIKLPPLSEEQRVASALSVRLRRPSAGYKGVRLIERSGRWCARIKVGGMGKHLGCFSTSEEAARSYDKAAFAAWGEECYLNFPDDFAIREAA